MDSMMLVIYKAIFMALKLHTKNCRTISKISLRISHKFCREPYGRLAIRSPKVTSKPSSGASIGISANSLQLTRRERYIASFFFFWKRKILYVQRDLRYSDFGPQSILKTKSSNFLIRIYVNLMMT
jgi:hypothetical protein